MSLYLQLDDVSANSCGWCSTHRLVSEIILRRACEPRKKAEEHRIKHGGEYILEWSGNLASGAPDAEFGKLVVEVPKKRGDGAARFYEKGLVLEKSDCPIDCPILKLKTYYW